MGAYLREGISYKRRIDIENIAPDLEHLFLEIPGRNQSGISLNLRTEPTGHATLFNQ